MEEEEDSNEEEGAPLDRRWADEPRTPTGSPLPKSCFPSAPGRRSLLLAFGAREFGRNP